MGTLRLSSARLNADHVLLLSPVTMQTRSHFQVSAEITTFIRQLNAWSALGLLLHHCQQALVVHRQLEA
jgi:hypothetical protein